ncbi:MAG: nicotinate (nicotinamide) nucleotide adenylyltransferase [Bdellovibrionales bacterium]
MMKIGIFGGSFNPPHMGHITCLTTVQKKAGLDKVFVVPSFQSPLKTPIEGPTVEQRLEMVKLALQGFGSAFEVDVQEIKRGGVSYTIDTLQAFRKKYEAEDLYLILGADHLETFDSWKDYRQILKETNLIIATRPGFEIPSSKEKLPRYLQEFVLEYDFNYVELTTGRNLQFIRLPDVDVSASELRKKIRSGRPVEKFLPLSVESYIRDLGLYRLGKDKVSDYEKFTEFCAHQLFSRKAINVKGFDLRKMSAPSEFAIVTSGTSTRHASSLAENLVQAVKDEFRIHPLSLEGLEEGRWVVVDYGSLIVHVFYDFVRQEYNIERLWREGLDMNLADPFTEHKK